jgi:hypothetical protein
MTSKRTIRLLIGFAMIPAMGWLLPAALWGQDPAVAGASVYATVTPAGLKLRAEDLSSDPATFGQAGDLFEQAARMLPVEDEAGVGLLIRAARLQYFGGALDRALVSMKEAGWRALGQGKVQVAANAYADAALIAVADQDKEAALKLAGIVKLLAQWPGVTPAESRQINKRIS